MGRHLWKWSIQVTSPVGMWNPSTWYIMQPLTNMTAPFVLSFIFNDLSLRLCNLPKFRWHVWQNLLYNVNAHVPVCLRYIKLFSSTGKKPIVAPYSGHIFAIVALSAMDKWLTPGPKNSTNLPTTPTWRRCCKGKTQATSITLLFLLWKTNLLVVLSCIHSLFCHL